MRNLPWKQKYESCVLQFALGEVGRGDHNQTEETEELEEGKKEVGREEKQAEKSLEEKKKQKII